MLKQINPRWKSIIGVVLSTLLFVGYLGTGNLIFIILTFLSLMFNLAVYFYYEFIKSGGW